MVETKLSSKRKMKNALFILFFILLALLIRVAVIQFVQGKELSKLAYEQQTLDRTINPKRGTIYDESGKNVLAQSSTVKSCKSIKRNI